MLAGLDFLDFFFFLRSKDFVDLATKVVISPVYIGTTKMWFFGKGFCLVKRLAADIVLRSWF